MNYSWNFLCSRFVTSLPPHSAHLSRNKYYRAYNPVDFTLLAFPRVKSLSLLSGFLPTRETDLLSFTRLQSLRFYWDLLPQRSNVLPHLTSLTELTIEGGRHRGNTTLRLLDNLHHLTRLVLIRHSVLQNEISSLTSLRHLALSLSPVTMHELSPLTSLTSLHLHRARELSSDCLSSFSSLSHLVIRESPNRHAVLSSLPCPHILLTLSLDESCNDTDIELSRFISLASLSLTGDMPSFTGSAFSNLTNLTRLNLDSNANIDDSFIPALSRLLHLSLDGTTPVKRSVLSQLTALNSLSISRNPFITDETIATISRLRTLSLRDNLVVTGRSLSNLTNLTALDLTKASAAPLVPWERMKALRRLIVSHNSLISDEILFSLPELLSIDLGDCTPEGYPSLRLSSLDTLETVIARSRYLLRKCQPPRATKLRGSSRGLFDHE